MELLRNNVFDGGYRLSFVFLRMWNYAADLPEKFVYNSREAYILYIIVLSCDVNLLRLNKNDLISDTANGLSSRSCIN